MDVKHLLPRRFAVGEEEVDPFAPHARPPDRARQAQRDPKKVPTELSFQVGQMHRVPPGNSQQLTGVDRPTVEERDGDVVFMNDARLSPLRDDVAEHAAFRARPSRIKRGAGDRHRVRIRPNEPTNPTDATPLI